jgi:hypothetical protein
MQILCSKSGLLVKVQHFPAFLDSRDAHHPIFQLPQKKLLGFLGKWSGGELTSDDCYLLYLALLDSTGLVHWRVPACKYEHTDSLIANNMAELAKVISRLNSIITPSFRAPQIAITPDSKTLENSRHWIDAWNNAYSDFKSGYARELENEKQTRRERAIEALIKNPNKSASHYSHSIAEWASVAGEFPNSLTLVDGKSIPLSEYWKSLIRLCAKGERLWALPTEDMQELHEHCLENIDGGSIIAHALFELIRAGVSKQAAYAGFGDVDLLSTKFRILDASASVEDANRLAMIDSAPLEEPRRAQYPSEIAWFIAKGKWRMAREHARGMSALAEANKQSINESNESQGESK